MKFTPSLLTSLHLTEDQAAVYVASLELGEATIVEIARKSGVKRSSIYNFLEHLKERGLLLETKKRKRSVFSAADPEVLLNLEQTRLQELQRILPELGAIANSSRTKPRVRFFEGKDGIKHVYADSLRNRNTKIHGFSDFENGVKIMGEQFYTEYYMPERVQRGILYRGILRDTPAARQYQQRDNRDLRESKIAPGEGVSTEIDMYGDTVAIKSFRSKTPFGVLIDDHDIAQSLRYIWEQLWDRLESF